MASRSKDKADTAIQELKAQTDGKEAIFLELDLGNLASVRKAAEEYMRHVSHTAYSLVAMPHNVYAAKRRSFMSWSTTRKPRIYIYIVRYA